MELAIMILCAIALMGIAWFLNRAPFTVIGKHHGDANPHPYPPNAAPDSGGVPPLVYGSGTGSSDGGCGDGGGGNQ